MFTSGCESYTTVPKSDIDWMVIKSLPPFPSPHPNVVNELNEVCPHGKCNSLYEWFFKLKVLDEQMELYKASINEQ